MQSSGTVGDLLINRENQSVSYGEKFRKSALVSPPKRFQAFSLGEFHLLLRATRKIVRNAEKQYFHSHGRLKNHPAFCNWLKHLVYTARLETIWRNPFSAIHAWFAEPVGGNQFQPSTCRKAPSSSGKPKT
jgi:hypothetical protein